MAGVVAAGMTVVAIPVAILLVLWLTPSAAFMMAQETSVHPPVEFGRDRALLEGVVTWVEGNADCEDYYVHLPERFAGLSYGGLVSCGDDEVFIPQWAGIPDDAGGFWYCPSRSPEGNDMWGMICRDPVDLGDGWWECGMR